MRRRRVVKTVSSRLTPTTAVDQPSALYDTAVAIIVEGADPGNGAGRPGARDVGRARDRLAGRRGDRRRGHSGGGAVTAGKRTPEEVRVLAAAFLGVRVGELLPHLQNVVPNSSVAHTEYLADCPSCGQHVLSFKRLDPGSTKNDEGRVVYSPRS